MRTPALVLVVVLVAGCLKATPTACATPPSPPFELDLGFVEPCSFHGPDGVVAILVLRANVDLGEVEMGFTLDEGTEVVSGRTSRLDVAGEGHRSELKARIRATDGEPHVVRGWVVAERTGMGGVGAVQGAGRNVGLRLVDGETRAFRPLSEEHGLRVEVDGAPEDASRLVVRASSAKGVDATVRLFLSWPPLGPSPEGYDPEDPEARVWPVEGHPEWTGEDRWFGDIVRGAWLEWRGPLRPGEPVELRFDAPLPPEGGPWTVAAYLVPDVRVADPPPPAEASFWNEDGRGVIEPR